MSSVKARFIYPTNPPNTHTHAHTLSLSHTHSLPHVSVCLYFFDFSQILKYININLTRIHPIKKFQSNLGKPSMTVSPTR